MTGLPTPPLRGRWAQGLEPRNFTWVVRERLAASERPGGFARNHRKVRRQEELIWLAQHGFTHLCSLLDSPHNLQAYEDAGLAHSNLPLGRVDEALERLPPIYAQLTAWLDDPAEKVLVHHEEFGDRILGVLAGFLLYARLVDSGPHAIQVVERLAGRDLGALARSYVALTIDHDLHR